MRKKHTSVSHGSKESEIVSLDAGLRMDGLLALDSWDVVIEVLRSSNSTKTPTNPAAGNCSRNHKSKPKQKGNRDVCVRSIRIEMYGVSVILSFQDLRLKALILFNTE